MVATRGERRRKWGKDELLLGCCRLLVVEEGATVGVWRKTRGGYCLNSHRGLQEEKFERGLGGVDGRKKKRKRGRKESGREERERKVKKIIFELYITCRVIV